MKKLIIAKFLFAAAFLSATLFLGSIQAQASESGSCGNGVTYTLDDNGTLTISGSGAIAWNPWTESAVKTVVINNGVTAIGDEAFFGCENLTNITIPNSVTSIGRWAFGECGLRSITLPEGVTRIGYSAFEECDSLESVRIPESVTSIEAYAFACCDNLSEIYFKGDAPEIGEGAFSDISARAYYPEGNNTWTYNNLLDYGGTIINWISVLATNDGIIYGIYYGEVTIDGYNGSSKQIVIPDKIEGYPVTKIADFNYSDFTSITIPESVINIYGESFCGCDNLASITIANANPRYHSAGNCIIDTSSKTLIAGCKNSVIPEDGSVTSIGDFAFCGCRNLTSIIIPKSVTSIGDEAFSGCDNLASITVASGNSTYHSSGNCIIETSSKTLVVGCKNSIIPEDGSVTSIGMAAFYDCQNLTSITIPDSVTSIEDWAFDGCSSLTNITISSSIRSIGGCAFIGCDSLITIYFKGDAPEIEEDAFSGVTATAYYPKGNATWTEEVCQDYEGDITWVAEGSGKTDIVKFSDGKWYYTVDGEKDLTFTGFASNANGRFRIEKGVVNFKYTDVVKDEDEWRYYSGGKWQTGVTSVEKRSNGTWWYVKKGVVQFGTTGLAKRTENSTWWYVKGGQVQFNYTGFENYGSTRYRVEKGQVNFKYADVVKDGNEWRYYSGGKWQTGVTSVEKRSNGTWWYVKKGVVQFGVTDVVKRTENNTWWYVKGGQVQTKLTSVVKKSDGTWWYIKNGQVQTNATGVVKRADNNTWWYVKGGKIQFNFTGIAKRIDNSSKWYVKNGRVQTSYSGKIKISGKTYNITKGKVK